MSLTPEQTEIRFRCLELAVGYGAPDLCEQFLAFVTGKSDQTPRQAIDAALDAANVR